LRDQVIDLPGPDNLTMTQLAQHLGASRTRRVPRGALRVLSGVVAPVAPAFARQTRAAVVMDTTDMSADASELCRRFPEITWHRAGEIADRFQTTHGGATAR
jgi:hypothetical protein